MHLEDEGRTIGQGMSSGNWERQGTGFSPGDSGRHRPADTLILAHEAFETSDLLNFKIINLYTATKFVVTC